MNSENGKIGFSVELDTSTLNRDIQKSKRAFEELGDQVESECAKIDGAIGGIGNSVASLGAAWSLQELAKKVATIRGEFQALQKTMEVMLQSKSKAEALMAQMVQTAATTPFGLQEVAGGAKQLLAYGLEAEKINETLIRLGNIASGLKIPLGDLIYLYGTTMAQGRLYTQDLNQFTGRGIPMLKGLADHFGIAEGKVKEFVEAGKVGFPEVQAVINSLTNEGGKFYNLMAEQSTLINGKISNLEDSFDMMFNEIGQANEGVINDAIDVTASLVENYKLVGDILLTLVADYGVYKASLMAVTAYTNSAYAYEIAQLRAVVAEKGVELDADLASAVAKGRITAARAAEVQALRMEIAEKIRLANVTEQALKAELAQITMRYESLQVSVALSKMRVTQAQQELATAQASGNATAIENARTELNTAIKERNNVMREASVLKRNMETTASNLNSAAQARETLTTNADTAAKRVNATTTSFLALCTNGATKAFKALTAAMAKNPFGLILIAITTVIGALMMMNDSMSETSEEIERFGESAVKQSRNVDTLLHVINSTSEKSKVHKEAVKELTGIYEEYGIKIDAEKSKLDQLNSSRENAIRLIREEGEERQKANMIATYDKAIEDEGKSLTDSLLSALQNAEFDGSGILDDWDFGDLQEAAGRLSTIIGGIMQSEGEELSRLTGEAYETKIEETLEKINETYSKLGFEGAMLSDVDERKLLEDYIEKVRALRLEREKLTNSIRQNNTEVRNEGVEINYSSLSFEKLFDAAYKVNTEVADIKPNIQTDPISNAVTLMNNLYETANDVMLLPWATMFPPEIPVPTLPSLPSNGVSGESDAQQKALAELDRRVVNALKTRKGTSDLLKEVNTALESAEIGSADEKRLLALQKRLQKQQEKLKQGATQQIRSNIERSNQAVLDELKKASQERLEAETNFSNTETQNRITLEKDASVRKRKQLELDHKKELEELERQRRNAIDAEKRRQKSIFDARENAKSASDKDYIKKNFTDADVDSSYVDAINKQYDTLLNQTKQLHKQNEVNMFKEEMQAMQDFLQNYGTFQQRKLAIAEEYAEKIRNASSEGEKITLAKERDTKISRVETDALKANINWTAVFGNFGSMYEDMIRPVLEDVKKYMDTDQFKNSDEASKQALITAVQQAEGNLGSSNRASFEKLGTEITNYQNALNKLKQEQTRYADAYSALVDAQNAYIKSLESGTEAEQEAAKVAVKSAKENEESAAQNVASAQQVVQTAQSTMTQTASVLKDGMEGTIEGLSKIASGSVSGAWVGIQQVTNSLSKLEGGFGDTMAKVSKALGDVPIIGWIVSIIDVFKDGLSVVIEGLLDAVFNAVAGILSDALSGDLIVTVINSVVKGVKNIFASVLDALTFGGFSSLTDTSNAKEVQETIDRLTNRNELLQTAIEDLTDEMKQGRGMKSVEEYKEAIKLQEEVNQNYLDIAKAQAGYHGSHHSWNYYWGGFSKDEIAKFGKQIDRDWNGDIWNLTPEEMKMLRANPDMWKKIQDTGKGGYGGRLTDELDKYIEQAGKIDELTTNLYEGLTQITFDSLYDNFINTLMDMDASAEDFSKDLTEYFTKAMLSNKIGELYATRLEDWWKSYGEAMKNDGKLDEKERDALTKEYDSIVEEAMKERDAIAAATGYDKTYEEQGSTKKGFETMSQETASELNGRFTAIQMDSSAIRDLMQSYSAEFSIFRAENRQNAQEIRNISLLAIDHLETISKNTHELFEINSRLAQIEKNTRRI